MSLALHNIKPKAGSRKRRKCLGRGLSKKGTYSGRGVKGQRARSGGRSGLQLKGLRKIMLSIPKKRGFHRSSPAVQVVNTGLLNKVFKDGSKVNPHTMRLKNLISSPVSVVKILGRGPLSIKLVVEGCEISASARALIEKAGGTVLVETRNQKSKNRKPVKK